MMPLSGSHPHNCKQFIKTYSFKRKCDYKCIFTSKFRIERNNRIFIKHIEALIE